MGFSSGEKSKANACASFAAVPKEMFTSPFSTFEM